MTVKLTEVATERFVDNITSITPGALRGGINSLAMHPKNDEFLVGGADGIPKIYRIFRETARKIGDDANLIRQFPKMNGRIFGVDLSDNAKFFAAVSTLNGKSEVVIYPYDFDGVLPANVKSAMAKRVTERSAEEKSLVDSFQSKTSEPVAKLEFDSTLYAAAFSPDGSQLLVGGGDGLLRVIQVEASADAVAGQVIQEFSPVVLNQGDSRVGGSELELLAGNGLAIQAEALPDAESEIGLLPASEVSSLEIYPKKLQFESTVDYAQVVVMARFVDGQSCDVTRFVEWSSFPGVDLKPLGLVRPASPGVGNLQANFRGQSAIISVQVGRGTDGQIADNAVGELASVGGVDFVRDVNPLLSRLGCNSGTCHGGQKGKNGFKLSLRGYDPYEDVRSLSDDLAARRLNIAAPDSSLMLLKPIGEVPHEGGVLLDKDSVHYATLRKWIAEGAALDPKSQKVVRIELEPKNPVIEREGAWQQFRVEAYFDDGEVRDVTQEAFVETGNKEVCESFSGGRVKAIRRGEAPILVRYEGAYAAATVTVMGDRNGFDWREPSTFSRIDELVAQKWERMKIEPSGLCSDAEFLRRVRLDLTGLPPTGEELKAFLADNRNSQLKRQEKIDELIGNPSYVEHWTNKWADLLQVNSKFLGREGATALRQWIRKQVAENRPYDEFARDVLTASGSNKANPPASYYKILRDPDMIMENTTHLFLAIRFNCNKCHDHPFERWTQDQYYEMAAFFAQTGLKEDPASEGKKIGGSAVEGAKPLYEEVFDKSTGEIEHVRTGKAVEPSFPYEVEIDIPEDASRREKLAAWITASNNPYFAKSFVNRIWGYLLGTGLIEPLDDIRAGNPPTNPELLNYLTEEFVRSGFDTQQLVRLITNSRTYQLSVASNSWNEDDTINYSHAKARRLPAEVLYDAVYHVTGAVSNIPGVAPGTRAAELPDVALQLPDGFLNNLGRPVRESACECERSDGLQLGPIMALVSGPTIGQAISDPKCALPNLVGSELSDEQLVSEIYLRVLSRYPSEEETKAIVSAAEQIAVDHLRLEEQLKGREAWWAAEESRLEQARNEQLAAAKSDVDKRQREIAPEREQLQKERAARIAAAEKTLGDYASNPVAVANRYLASHADFNEWIPLAPTGLETSNGVVLQPQADRSIVATGNAPKGTYTIKYKTNLQGIRGVRLEALPQPGLPGGGPGLPQNGNFVITEIELEAASAGNPNEVKRIKLQNGKADFSQSGFAADQAVDGNTGDQKGWAISPLGGMVHWATWETEQAVGTEASATELTFTIHQKHNAADHSLAHFRISVTTDQGDIKLSLPEAFVAYSAMPESQRTAESLGALIRFLEKQDGEWTRLRAAVAEAKKPLPADERLVALERVVKEFETPTPIDAKLAELRKDFETSALQLENRRLTLAQDLTWALINSPAFLFNH